MINLNRITVKNFKIFGEEPYIISFEDHNLILLDGPNGYGKTSVFDAIELGLTGNITRLISLENRQNPADVVVAHQGARDVEIILEFKDNDSKVKVFQRKLKDTIPNDARKISKFTELWELNEIVDGVPVSAPENALDAYFDSKDFSRDFLLFHYVQQEETSRFLKTNNEAQRAVELAQLFGNTREADEKFNKLSDFSRKITISKRNVTSQIENIKRLYKIDDNMSIATGVVGLHFHAFPLLASLGKTVSWDAVTIPELNQEKFNSYLAEINNVKNLLRHQNFFLRSRRFDNATLQQEMLGLYVGYFHSITNNERLVANSDTYQLIRHAHSMLRSGDLKQIRSISKFDVIFQAVGLSSSASFETALQTRIDEENNANGLSSIYSELIKHHDAMISGFNKIPNESTCLLCGQDYESHDALSRAISQHGHLLRSELSGTDNLLVAARDTFNSNHLSPLIQMCTTYLEQTLAPSQEDLRSLSKAVAARERLDGLRKWLLSERIEHDDLIANSFPVEGGSNYISGAIEILCQRIRSVIGTASEGYYEANGSSIFERVYRDYFNSEQEKLGQIDISLLDKKEDYIKNLYFNSLKDISDELIKLSKQSQLLERALGDVAELTTIVRTQIRQYRKKLITDIEIR
ncbi:MAG: AAA family ATPase [Agitococcus sp.]|nr:AAA family ATPase [Agitococcus sp.]